MLTIGSLFSGIGGLELGLEAAGLGPTLWQVELDAYRRSILARHWPRAVRFDDVRTFARAGVRPRRVDLVCGGFPCQDISSAGARAGLAGERSGLWREFARVVSVVEPGWVVVENVASNARAWVDPVVRELERLGYACLPLPISASNVGAWHRRSRVFVLGRRAPDADDRPEPNEPRLAEVAEASRARGALPDAPEGVGATDGELSSGEPDAAKGIRRFPSWAGGAFATPDVVRMVHGLPRGVDPIRTARVAALGDSVVPQCAEVVGWVIREIDGR